MVTTTRRITLAELERDGGPEGLWEVINGELIEMSPAGGKHGRIWNAINAHLWQFVVPNGLGLVYGADTGFILAEDPLQLRLPDVGYVSYERLPADFDDGGYPRVAPDLAVEVLSPSDRSVPVLAKVMTWLEAGTALVWLVDPEAETVTVFGSAASPRVVTIDQTLDGGDVLPGLMLPVRDIFALPVRRPAS
ncbi:MAG: Uma2 family endonuclease [Chloroflexota bacterium]|nr:Uma2 family endonuclease [Chloroflexota bacterium]